MAVHGDGRDSASWKVVAFNGEILRDAKGKKLDSFSGYQAANKVARQRGGVAVRK